MNAPVPIPDSVPQRKISPLLFFAYVLLISILLTIAACALSATIIRSIDDILPDIAPVLGIDSGTAAVLADIFSQLDDANLSVHHEVPAVLSFLFTLGIGLMIRAGYRSERCPFALVVILASVTGLLFALFSLILSVWMTDVNDIRFGDVVLSLAKMIRAGVLDSL